MLPSEQGELHYSDWAKMVSGLMPDTPLGQIVGIRCERDSKVISRFTPAQRQVQADWRAFSVMRAAKSASGEPDKVRKKMDELEKMIAGIFG